MWTSPIFWQEFDRTLKGKPQVLGPNTQLPKGADTSAAPAPTDPTVAAAPATREKKKQKKKKKEDSEVPATPAPKGKARARAKVIQLRGEPLLVEQEEVGMATLLPVLNKHVVRVR